MPHQDEDHLRSNLESLKAVFDRLLPAEMAHVKRHGNARLEPWWLTAVAMTCWGWLTQGTLSERVQTACAVVGRLFQVETTVTRQGLMKALAGGGNALVEMVMTHFAQTLPQLKGRWTSGGKVNVAVDGSKISAARTKANQRCFAAVARKTNCRGRAYQKQADQSKASTVQVLVTVFWHLGLGLPLRWKAEGSCGSERKNVQQAVGQLPANTRLIGDAEYVGYPLWSTIIGSQRSFLFRVGSNVTLLKNLGRYKIRDGYVYFWPDWALNKNQPPLVLRMFVLHNGKKSIYLVTNELAMTETQACELYKQRWGVEVFFRCVKQTCGRRKLTCGVPENVLTEFHWTLIGIWAALFAGKETLRETHAPLEQLSPVRVMRAFALTIQGIAWDARQLPLLNDLLAQATMADESNRTSSKRSRHYPRKKKHRHCGAPKILPANTIQKQKAKKLNI